MAGKNSYIIPNDSSVAKLKNFLHIFSRGKQRYAFATVANRLWKLSKEEYDLLKSLWDGVPIEVLRESYSKFFSVDDFLNQLIEASVLEDGGRSDILSNVTSMILLITERCNFSCTYCYGAYGEKHSEMNLDTAIAAVNLAVNLGVKDIVFLGGEPLLNWPLIKELTPYIESFQKGISIRITTNGSLVTEEIAQFFDEHNVEVSVSMDGPLEEHNKTRQYKNGFGTFDAVQRGIEILQKHGVLKLIEITHSRRHGDILKQIEYAFTLCPTVSCALVDGRMGCKHDAEVVRGDDISVLYSTVLDFLDEHDGEEKCLLGIRELYDCLCNGKPFMPSEHLCSDIESRIVVMSDGSITPCPEMVRPPYIIGNVHTTSKEDFYMNRDKVLAALSRRNLKSEWFSNICDTCIQHVNETEGKFSYEDQEGFGKCIEDLLIRIDRNNG